LYEIVLGAFQHPAIDGYFQSVQFTGSQVLVHEFGACGRCSR
jgi:hypothetical protein